MHKKHTKNCLKSCACIWLTEIGERRHGHLEVGGTLGVLAESFSVQGRKWNWSDDCWTGDLVLNVFREITDKVKAFMEAEKLVRHVYLLHEWHLFAEIVLHL